MSDYADEDETRRFFDPASSPKHSRVPESQLILYDPEKQLSKLQMFALSIKSVVVDPMTLVVHINGACRNNGCPTAQAS